jgi:polyisoprenoid-binding protein YceI
MTLARSTTLVLSFLALSSQTARADPQPYAIDEARSRIVVHVGKTGLLGFAGHEHEILGTVSHAALVVDPAHVEASSVDLDFAAGKLRVVGSGEPAKDLPKIQQAMLGPDCLDVDRFPVIRFVSKAISARPPSRGGLDVTVRGTLTLRGVSREIDVPVHVELRDALLSAKGTVALKQTTFGITPVSVAGVVKVKDELQIEFWLVAHRAR